MQSDKQVIFWRLVSDAYDYFSKLGGSGRYSGFEEWHPMALVVLLISGVIPPRDLSKLEQLHHLLPESMWFKTDSLPKKILDQILNNEVLPGGNQFTGTEANYIQFKTELECRSAERDLNGISQKILNINGNAYSPVAICMKNGIPVLHPKINQK